MSCLCRGGAVQWRRPAGITPSSTRYARGFSANGRSRLDTRGRLRYAGKGKTAGERLKAREEGKKARPDQFVRDPGLRVMRCDNSHHPSHLDQLVFIE